MSQDIFENNPPIHLFRRRRTRRLRISINSSGEVVVTRPWFVNERLAKEFVRQQRDWITKHLAIWQNINASNLHPGGSNADYQANKEKARTLINARLAHFNQIYNFSWTKISIKNQKTRWGSCSRHGSLNFNYRLVVLPPELSDYIIVHELCHLQEFNHSPRFWRLVARVLPDYRERRRRLRGRVA